MRAANEKRKETDEGQKNIDKKSTKTNIYKNVIENVKDKITGIKLKYARNN